MPNYARQQQVEMYPTWLAISAGWIDAMGGAGDLTWLWAHPAPTRVPDLHKLMASSRGYCLHVSFVQARIVKG